MVCIILNLVPGDPIDHILGDQAQSYSKEALAKELGLINENGEIESIYMVSEGENYPIGDVNINTDQQIADTYPSEITTYISDVLVVEPGIDYTSNDVVFDD